MVFIYHIVYFERVLGDNNIKFKNNKLIQKDFHACFYFPNLIYINIKPITNKFFGCSNSNGFQQIHWQIGSKIFRIENLFDTTDRWNNFKILIVSIKTSCFFFWNNKHSPLNIFIDNTNFLQFPELWKFIVIIAYVKNTPHFVFCSKNRYPLDPKNIEKQKKLDENENNQEWYT